MSLAQPSCTLCKVPSLRAAGQQVIDVKANAPLCPPAVDFNSFTQFQLLLKPQSWRPRKACRDQELCRACDSSSIVLHIVLQTITKSFARVYSVEKEYVAAALTIEVCEKFQGNASVSQQLRSRSPETETLKWKERNLRIYRAGPGTTYL